MKTLLGIGLLALLATSVHAQVKWHGRLHVDVGAYVPDTALAHAADATAGVGMRRVRLTAKGKYKPGLSYAVSVDFGKNKVSIKDAYVDFDLYATTDHARLRVGHFKEPYRWDVLNSSNRILLPGRPDVLGAFGKERNAGAMLYGYIAPRVGYQVGVFRNYNAGAQQVVELAANGSIVNTNRLAWLPIHTDNQWLMVAGYFRHQVGQGTNYSIKAGAESIFAPKLVKISIDTFRNGRWIGGELAASFGPLYFQTEYLMFSGTDVGRGTVAFSGGYVQAAYVLSGEHRPIKSVFGGIKEISPAKPWDGQNGWGAWEVVARYGVGDFNDALYKKGGLSTLSVGLNWYPYSKARVMLNYVRPMLQGSEDIPDGAAHIFQTRLMVFF